MCERGAQCKLSLKTKFDGLIYMRTDCAIWSPSRTLNASKVNAKIPLHNLCTIRAQLMHRRFQSDVTLSNRAPA